MICRQCNARYDDPAPRFCGRCGADLRLIAEGTASDGNTALAVDEEGVEGPDPLIGRVIAGRYRMLERIGEGGMGVVYRVEHTAIGKIAALKMLHPMLSSDRDLVKRFRMEARAVSLLTHPNTVQVFDFGEADGSLFMVMELVRGQDLSAIVDQDGPLPWRRASVLLSQICEALAEAHEAGIIHRDIKPENVLVCRTREGRETVKVLDFGLAKLREKPELGSVTGRGILIGTPYYMSPEQIRGEELDPRSDIYSLGGLAYRLLTGEVPFEGKTPVAVLTAHLTEPYRPMAKRRPDLTFDRAVEDVVARCLARDPADRFKSADEVRRAIEEARQAQTQRTVVAPPKPEGGAQLQIVPPTQLSREDFDRFERSLERRRRVRLGLLFAGLAGSVGFGAWKLTRDPVEKPVTEEIEPNNEASQANPIASGLAVRGHIGKRLSLESSDRDFYRFSVPRGSAPVVARLELTGIPNIDLHLAVYDGLSDKLAETDAGGPGDGEVIPNLRLDAGDYYLSVREVWVGGGGMATENVTDWYTLRATWRALAGVEETEPDDTPAQALPIPVGQPVPGYLGTANDLDFFYPRDEASGALAGRVSGIPGVDVRLVVLPPGSVVSGDPAQVRGARVFDAGGPGAAEQFADIPWPVGGPAPLVVVARKDKTDPAGRHAALVGTDVPYALVLSRSGAAPGGAAAIPPSGATPENGTPAPVNPFGPSPAPSTLPSVVGEPARPGTSNPAAGIAAPPTQVPSVSPSPAATGNPPAATGNAPAATGNAPAATGNPTSSAPASSPAPSSSSSVAPAPASSTHGDAGGPAPAPPSEARPPSPTAAPPPPEPSAPSSPGVTPPPPATSSDPAPIAPAPTAHTPIAPARDPAPSPATDGGR